MPGWTEAQFEQAGAVTDQPSGSPPAFCSPCHSAAITLLFGVAAFSGGLVATGLEEPPAHTAAWISPDGASWNRVQAFPAEEGSVGVAVAADAGRAVIVGRNNAGATAWASTDGTHWTAAPDLADLAGPAGATQMNAVVAFNGRFVAGGYSDDPLHGTRTAAVWTSADGLAWKRVALPAAGTFDGAHILAMAAGGNGIAAIGTTHDETHGTGVAWISRDGTTWQRDAAPDLASGIPRSVADRGAAGFVAVGLTAADTGAASWTSADGLTWHAVADQAAFHFGTSPTRMLGIATGPAGATELVAVGWRSDAGNGSAVVWDSTDAITWTREPTLPAFSGATMSGTAATVAGALVAVGTSGYPDNDAAVVWRRAP